MLTAQFLLGMAVNLLGQPRSTLTNVIKATLLGLHIVVAIGLVIGMGLL